MPEWDAEVEVDEALARALISDAYPALGAGSLRSPDVGWDNTAWLADENVVSRFPRRDPDPTAALLFPDFDSGRRVQLSGTARTEWTTPGTAAGDDDATGRRVRFTPDEVVAGRRLGVHATPTVPYDDNPPLTGGPS